MSYAAQLSYATFSHMQIQAWATGTYSALTKKMGRAHARPLTASPTHFRNYVEGAQEDGMNGWVVITGNREFD